MSRKTVRVTIPENIDELVVTLERMVLRNDGVLPAVPASTIYIAIGALVGVTVPAVTGGSTGTPPPPPPGTHKIPEDLAAPMRTMYPGVKRAYLDLVALRSLTQTTSNNLQQSLGLATGQSVSSEGTARNLISRAVKVLLGVFSGRENELETYGIPVSIGTAAAPRRTNGSNGAPPTLVAAAR
jgi:hypothetical protein